MTQTAEFERKDFTSVPNIIYDGYPELKPLDRHVASVLLRRCWKAGWHALSMRELGNLSGVPHNLMRSIETREGILNRLQRITENIFRFKDGVANKQGKKGRPQTYVFVDTIRLWKANAAFYSAHEELTRFEEPSTEDTITVSDGYSHPTKGRRKSVSPEYTSVSTGYSEVSSEYSTVSNVSVNAGTKITKIEDTQIFTPAHESGNSQSGQNPTEEKKKTLISHPEHSFLWFDDLLAPSTMTIELTTPYPSAYFSPDEDKRRERVAGEIEHFLRMRGLQITVNWEHEAKLATVVTSSVITAPSEHLSYSQDTQPTDVASGVSPENWEQAQQRIAELERLLASQQKPSENVVAPPPWLQENKPNNINSSQDTPSAPPVVAPQTSVRPTTSKGAVPNGGLWSDGEQKPTIPEKPAKQYNIPTDLTAGLNERDVRKPLSDKEKKRLQAVRKQEIYTLFGNLTGRSTVDNQDNREGADQLVKADATDSEITLTYETYKNHTYWGPQLTLKVIAKFLNAAVGMSKQGKIIPIEQGQQQRQYKGSPTGYVKTPEQMAEDQRLSDQRIAALAAQYGYEEPSCVAVNQ